VSRDRSYFDSWFTCNRSANLSHFREYCASATNSDNLRGRGSLDETSHNGGAILG